MAGNAGLRESSSTAQRAGRVASFFLPMIAFVVARASARPLCRDGALPRLRRCAVQGGYRLVIAALAVGLRHRGASSIVVFEMWLPGAAAQGAARSRCSASRLNGRRRSWITRLPAAWLRRRADHAITSLLMMVGVLLGILVGVLPGLGAPNGVSLLLPLTFTHGSGLGDHPAHQHVLGRAVRRLDHLDPVQHPRRAVLGRDDLRRLSDGASRARPTEALTLRLPVGRLRRAGRRHPHHAAVGLGREFRAALLARRNISPSISWPSPASSGLGGASPLKTVVSMVLGFALRRGRHGHDLGQPAPDLRLRRAARAASASSIAVIGLFGIGELLLTMEEGLQFEGIKARGQPARRARDHRRACRATGWRCCARSLIGCWMGITPGGPTAASFMSYGLAKRFSRQRGQVRQGRAGGRRSRPRPPTTPPAPAPCCRCWRSASRARRPPP